jgi:hypothetical protein
VLFPLFSLNYFEWSDAIAADISLGLSGPVLGLGPLINGLKPLLLTFLLPQITGPNLLWLWESLKANI